MSASSGDFSASARKIEQAILHRLASVGQARVAEAIGVSESTVSRMKDADIERMAKMLAVLGLKCVPSSARCFDPGQINAILTLAKARMRDVESADELLWQDDV